MPPKTANRNTGSSTTSQSPKATSPATAADAVEQKVVALAEQMGRLIGTVQAKAEGWLDPQYMREQITRIQDGATDLLSHLGTGAGKQTEPAPQPAVRPARSRSGGKVDAPGKKHRPPPPSTRQAKQAIARGSKLKAPNKTIRRPRQG